MSSCHSSEQQAQPAGAPVSSAASAGVGSAGSGNTPSAESNGDWETYLKDPVQQTLSRERTAIEKNRVKEVELLTKSIASENGFLKDWGYPLELSDMTYPENDVDDAKEWLTGRQNDLKKFRIIRNGKKEKKQIEIADSEAKIKVEESELKERIKARQGVDDAVKTAKDNLGKAKAAYAEVADRPDDDPAKVILRTELKIAVVRMMQYCKSGPQNPDTWDPDVKKWDPDQEECAKYYKANRLDPVIEKLIAAWNEEKKHLICLSSELEGFENEIKIVDKNLEYIKTYEKVLLDQWLERNRPNA